MCGLMLAGALLSSCGGGSGTPSQIALVVTLEPPPSLSVNASTPIAASVTNDPLHRGVVWTCVPLTTCGTLTPEVTPSGASTIYTAPAMRGSVTITATAADSSSATQNLTINIVSPITVTITQAPAISIQAGTSAPVAASVAGDSANQGVDWSCSPAGTCGSFTPKHTASGVASTYMAPSTGGTVTITATSTSDKTSYATASFNVFTVIGVGNLSGNYGFYLSGQDKNHNPYALAGAIVLDGMGGVKGGEQDVNNGSSTISPEPSGDAITGGSYTLGPDGQGTVTLHTNNPNAGVGGTETLAIVRVNDQHVLITQFDSGATASGSLDSQTFFPNNSAQISGGYSFVLSGGGSGGGLVEGGVFTSAGGGLLNNIVMDQDIAGVTNLGLQYSGTYNMPDAYGRSRVSFGGLNFSFYIIGVEALRMIETDASRAAVGSAFGQGALSGSASTASLTGNFVFTLSSGPSGALFGAAGIMNPNGRGKLPGFADVNEAAKTVTSQIFASNYSMASNGYGRILITPGATQDVTTLGLYVTDPQLNLSDPNNANGGGGALLADLDANLVGAGMMVPQLTGSSVNGSFAAGFQGLRSSGEEDFVGAGTTTQGGPIAGTGMWNELFGGGQTSGVPFAVGLTADPLHAGRFTAVVAFNGGTTTNNFVVYQATSQVLIGAEVDPQQPGVGSLQQQK